LARLSLQSNVMLAGPYPAGYFFAVFVLDKIIGSKENLVYQVYEVC